MMTIRSFSCLLWLFLLSVVPSVGQESGQYMFKQQLPLFLDSLQSELTYPMAWGNSKIKRFSRWRAAGRALLRREMLMPPRPAADAAFQVVAEEHRDGYTVQKIVFNLTHYSRVSAYLTVPDGGGRHAAVLLLHDHGGHFSIGKEKMVRPFAVPDSVLADAEAWCRRCYGGRFVADYLSRHGFVTLTVDAPFWGARGEAEGSVGSDYRYVAGHFMLLGRNLSAWMTFEDEYAARFLASLPCVDASRVGCFGFSMGAYRAWMLSALSDVVRCGVAVCWMHTTAYQVNARYGLKKHEEWANLVPGMRRYMDYPDIASLACPKPMLFINGNQDHLFPEPSVCKAFDKMHAVWRGQHADSLLETEIWSQGHVCGTDVQDRVLRFLEKRLLGK